jgi:hypothetical protein
MKALGAAGVVITLALAGCSSNQPIEPPEISQFPHREYRLHVNGTPEMVRRTIASQLEQLSVPFTYETGSQERHIVSTYVEDSESAGWLREERCSVLVTLRKDTIYPQCTSMTLRWLVESQGVFQDAWKTDGHNGNDVPSLLKRMQDYAAANSCLQ